MAGQVLCSGEMSKSKRSPRCHEYYMYIYILYLLDNLSGQGVPSPLICGVKNVLGRERFGGNRRQRPRRWLLPLLQCLARPSNHAGGRRICLPAPPLPASAGPPVARHDLSKDYIGWR